MFSAVSERICWRVRGTLPKLAGMCKNPPVDVDSPAVAELMADVAVAVSRRVGWWRSARSHPWR